MIGGTIEKSLELAKISIVKNCFLKNDKNLLTLLEDE
jgi:hypothetical protein